MLLDNRDAGLSTQTGSPDQKIGNYSMSDMAKDVLAVADDLNLKKFHVLGQSMGGMIVQQLLAEHLERLITATIFYSTPSFSAQFQANEESEQAGSHAGLEPHDHADQALAAMFERVLICRKGSSYPLDREALWQNVKDSYQRCYRPDGTARQLGAIAKYRISAEQLQAVNIPVSVWHGKADPFFGVQAAWYIATQIPTAELHLFPGMAHEFPAPLIPLFVEGVSRQILTHPH